jgi:hypothetical protein
MFIRGDEPLWYCDIGSDGNATVMGADIDLTRQLLEALLTATGVPPLESDLLARMPAPVPPVQQVYFPQAQPPVAGTLSFCTSCGSHLKVEARFCASCGALSN